MSNMIIIMKKAKCSDQQKQRLIKISDMLRKPLKKLPETIPKKSIVNQDRSYFSMFLQPIDQHYGHLQFEEHPDNPTVFGRFDLLNYSTDSSEEFQKKLKDSDSKNLIGREEISARRRITLQAKKEVTSIKDMLKNPKISEKDRSRPQFQQSNNIPNIYYSNISGKIKLTKLLSPGWEKKIPFDKNKSLQKIIIDIRGKFLDIKRVTYKMRSLSKAQITLKNNIKSNNKNMSNNNSINNHNRFYSGNNTQKVPNNFDNKNKNIFFRDEYNVNNNKSMVQDRNPININKYNTCNNCNEKDINYFPLKKVCEFKHKINVERNLISKIRYRRPVSVD